MKFQQQKYFRPYRQIVGRQTAKTEEPTFQTPSTHKKSNKKQNKIINPLQQPIWEHLYYEGIKKYQKRYEDHLQLQNKIDLQCTFQPFLKHNRRYMIPSHSNFLQRNYVWQQNKIEKIIKEKEGNLMKGLKECTFRPQINHKYYKYRINNHERQMTPKRIVRKKQQPMYTPPKYESRNSLIPLDKAKLIIRNQLKKMAL